MKSIKLNKIMLALITASCLTVLLPVSVYAETKGDASKEMMKDLISIEDAIIKVDDIKYTGEGLEPTVNVIVDNKTLVMNEDYRLTYLHNIDIGTGSVTVTGMGKYTGFTLKTFNVLPGDIVLHIKSTTGTTIRCAWDAVKGVSGYQIAYKTAGKKTKYVTTTGTSKTLTKLSKNRTYTVRVRAYTDTGSKRVYGDYSAIKKAKTLTAAMRNSVNLYSSHAFRNTGVVNYKGWRWTYYSQKELSGRGLSIPGRHVNSNGYVCDKDGYIVLASSRLSKGSEVATPFGIAGKVYDSGCANNTLDVYVNW